MPLEGTAEAVVDQPVTGVPPAGGDTPPSSDPNATTPPSDPAAAGQGDDAADTPHPELLSREEFEKVKDDPKALIKLLNKGYTTRSQEIAPYRKLIEAYKANPAETVRLLAEHHKLINQPAPTPASEAVDEINTILEDALGSEVAQKLRPAFEKMAERVASSQVQPVKDYVDQSMATAALQKTQAVMSQFEAKHPDWKSHEPKMMEIAAGFQPGPNTDPIAYMDHLYKLATYDLSDADRVKGTITRINDAANASSAPAGTAPGKSVAQAPRKFDSVGEATAAAFAAAKRGERWE